jgi:hypothetical protein
MNKDKREALARIDGYIQIKRSGPYNTLCGLKPFKRWKRLPAYDTHDDLQRLIDGLNRIELNVFIRTLTSIVIRDCGEARYQCCNVVSAFAVAKATVDQKTEALLRAKGVTDE